MKYNVFFQILILLQCTCLFGHSFEGIKKYTNNRSQPNGYRYARYIVSGCLNEAKNEKQIVRVKSKTNKIYFSKNKVADRHGLWYGGGVCLICKIP